MNPNAEGAMQNDAISVLRQNIEAFNSGDLDRFASTLAESGRYEELATHRVNTTRESELELTRGWRKAFPDARGTIKNIFGSGDQAVAEIVWEGTHSGTLESPDGAIAPSGKHVTIPASFVVKVRDGRIAESHHYFDLNTLLQQIH
jgi:steroid delta-isomerase-like uncharacterized protein